MTRIINTRVKTINNSNWFDFYLHFGDVVLHLSPAVAVHRTGLQFLAGGSNSFLCLILRRQPKMTAIVFCPPLKNKELIIEIVYS